MTKQDVKVALEKYFKRFWKEFKVAFPDLIDSVLQLIHCFIPFKIFTMKFWLS